MIGMHINCRVTSRGFTLNLDTDLSYFRYIMPCCLTEPVDSMRAFGCVAHSEEVTAILGQRFARAFDGILETN